MMKNLVAVIALLPLAITACSGSLSKEAGCREIGQYSAEAATTLDRAKSSISIDESRQLFAQRLVEIVEEAATLKIGDREVVDAVQSWASSTKEVGTALKDYDLSSASYAEKNVLFTILNEALIAESRLLRVCDL